MPSGSLFLSFLKSQCQIFIDLRFLKMGAGGWGWGGGTSLEPVPVLNKYLNSSHFNRNGNFFLVHSMFVYMNCMILKLSVPCTSSMNPLKSEGTFTTITQFILICMHLFLINIFFYIVTCHSTCHSNIEFLKTKIQKQQHAELFKKACR